MRRKYLIVVGFALAALIGAGATLYYMYMRQAKLQTSAAAWLAESTPTEQQTSPSSRTAPAGSSEYRNSAFHFSLFYPSELTKTEYVEGGGKALSVTFEDASGEKGFQIFVKPHQGEQISREEFLRDEPSGVKEQAVDVMIGGVRGTLFFSKNDIMGDTREVWFIRNGYLYEIVTYKNLDQWLADIMKTWEFL